MKKLLLLSLCACPLTHIYGALSSLKTAATTVGTSLRKKMGDHALRSFTTTTPLKRTVSDTIWQAPNGKLIRVMGDIHLPSDKPYFELLESSFKEIDKAGHKTTVLVEGGFNQETVATVNKKMKEEFSTIAMSKLNALTETTSFKNIKLRLTEVRTHPEFLDFMGSFTIINMFMDLVVNESFRSALIPETITTCKETFLNPRYFKCFDAHNLEKIDAHLREFTTQLEAFIVKENNSDITTLFSIPLAQINRLLPLFGHLKKIDMTKAAALTKDHFATLDVATFIEIATEIKKALLAEDAPVKECLSLINGNSFTSLSVTLEDAEILMRLLTATKAHDNFITYAGLAHSLNINKALETKGFKQVKHDGPTILEPSKIMSYGLDEETIKTNNALFLGLLQHR